MPARIPVAVDGPTVRLRHLAAAITAQGDVPAASAKRLSGLVRAVRGYAEAYEPALALAALAQVQAFAVDIEQAEPDSLVATALQKHVDTIGSALRGM